MLRYWLELLWKGLGDSFDAISPVSLRPTNEIYAATEKKANASLPVTTQPFQAPLTIQPAAIMSAPTVTNRATTVLV